MDSQHLVELETKISFQEVAIEKLQRTVFEQQSTIEKLEKVLKTLNERFESVVNGGNQIGPGNEKPPHY